MKGLERFIGGREGVGETPKAFGGYEIQGDSLELAIKQVLSADIARFPWGRWSSDLTWHMSWHCASGLA